jgi:hypothetical protein
MFIQIPCHTTINGVGQAVCDTCAPLILDYISEDDLTFINIHGEYVYYMTHMKFPILSEGKLESQRHEFHLRQSKPVMITTNKHKVPLIRDDVINFTWIAERPRVRTAILMKEKVAQDFDRDPESKVRRPVKIPVLENVDPTPVRPDNKENINTILDAHTKLQRLNFGGDGIRNNVETDGERRKSPRLVAKQIDTTHAMKNDTTPVMKRITTIQNCRKSVYISKLNHNVVNLNLVPASDM